MEERTVVKHGVEWKPCGEKEFITRFGGVPTASISYEGYDTTPFVASWPHFEGKPLPFFAQIVLNKDQAAYVFLDDTVEGSWQAEDGANAVLVSPIGTPVDWVEYKPLESDMGPLYSEKAYTPLSNLDEPVWLQGDETPDGYTFRLQVPSQIDTDGNVNIGDGYGDAYIFISDSDSSGRVLWQS